LKGDILSNQLCIQLCHLNLDNIDLGLAASHSLNVLAETVYFCATSADDHAWPGGVHRYLQPICCSLYLHPGNARGIKTLFDQLPQG
jgi:hypothetical protein